MLPRETLEKYSYNNVYIETGMYLGESLMTAASLNFRDIYGIEALESFLKRAQATITESFPSRKFNLILGSSSDILYDTIKNIKESITFFLDAHYQGEDERLRINPLYTELDHIHRHSSENNLRHVIMIDDVRLFGKENFSGLNKEIINTYLKKIHNDYNIVFETGYKAEDIMVAY